MTAVVTPGWQEKISAEGYSCSTIVDELKVLLSKEGCEIYAASVLAQIAEDLGGVDGAPLPKGAYISEVQASVSSILVFLRDHYLHDENILLPYAQRLVNVTKNLPVVSGAIAGDSPLLLLLNQSLRLELPPSVKYQFLLAYANVIERALDRMVDTSAFITFNRPDSWSRAILSIGQERFDFYYFTDIFENYNPRLRLLPQDFFYCALRVLAHIVRYSALCRMFYSPGLTLRDFARGVYPFLSDSSSQVR